MAEHPTQSRSAASMMEKPPRYRCRRPPRPLPRRADRDGLSTRPAACGRARVGGTVDLRHPVGASGAAGRLVILGGGPIGCELGQAFARLGGAATIAEIADRLLPQADPAAGALIADALVRDGVDVRTAARAVAVANDRLTVVGPGGRPRRWLSIGCSSQPAGHCAPPGWGLDRVGVATDARGFVGVDDPMRTAASS